MSDLRDQIADHLRHRPWDPSEDEALQLVSTHGRHNYHGLCGICRGDIRAIADAVMAAIQTELDKRDTEIERLRGLLDIAEACAPANNALTKKQRERAEQAEVELEQAERARANAVVRISEEYARAEIAVAELAIAKRAFADAIKSTSTIAARDQPKEGAP